MLGFQWLPVMDATGADSEGRRQYHPMVVLFGMMVVFCFADSMVFSIFI